ncbi:AbfB domain-containing protein [Streptomyces sp. NK08204]|uniref:AbfB domain-containing protein n=1 Tax=Streptomyces sp. NK08204 TaxID=2873260 RepID=UPI001CECBDEA
MDDTALFRPDATCCPQAGKSGTRISFASYSHPTRYLRHCNDHVCLASDGGSDAFDSGASWAADVSWAVSAPWTP